MSETGRLLSGYPVSTFFFILSTTSLLQFGHSSFAPPPVSEPVLVNGTSAYLKPSSESEGIEDGEATCPNSETGAFRQHRKENCDQNQALLRVYMYDLPPEFHFGLLGWKGEANQTWPDIVDYNHIPQYPGGMYLQNSIEYWLTLDLLGSNTQEVVRPCSAIRVENSSQADIIFVPFFSSLSYNKYCKKRGKKKLNDVNMQLQNKLVKFLMGRGEWKRLGGKDHLITAHHPNSLLYARKKLGSAMFLLADFGRFPVEIANIGKDIVAPYKHFVKTVMSNESAQFDKRPILLYFRGGIRRKAGGAIRQKLYNLLRDEKDVNFTQGTAGGDGFQKSRQGMGSSKFCLNIAGDTPSSNRLFDSIVSHCVPVIISDDIELPFEDTLDYSGFCLFVRAADALKKGYLMNLLRGVEKAEWTVLWERLKEVAPHFEYQYPSQPGDAVDMTWQTVSHKVSSIQLKLHRQNRYRRSYVSVQY